MTSHFGRGGFRVDSVCSRDVSLDGLNARDEPAADPKKLQVTALHRAADRAGMGWARCRAQNHARLIDVDAILLQDA